MKRVKYIAQIQQTECGLCVITMLLNFYGAHYSLYDVRKLVDVGRDGMSVSNVIHVLESFGLEAKGFRSQNIKDLTQLNGPFILTLQKNDLVIVEKIAKNVVYIMDPAIGRVKYSYAELSELFDGICIGVTPGEHFEKKKNEHKMFKLLLSLILERKGKYFLFICISFLNYLFMMLLLIYMQTFVDGIYRGETPFQHIWNIFLLIAIYISTATFMKFYMANLKTAVDKKINVKIIGNLLDLPYLFFDTRKKSDILFTLNHVSYVRDILVTNLLDIFINLGVLIVIWVYFLYSNHFMVVALNVVLVFNVCFALLSQRVLTNNMRKLVRENSKVQGYQMEMLYAMFSIKSSCNEEKIFKDWKEKYLIFNQKYGYNEKISAVWNTLLSIFQILSPLCVLGVGILMENQNITSMGKIITLFSMAEVFFSQVYELLNSMLNFSMNSVYAERLGDIFFAEKDKRPEMEIEKIEYIHSVHVEDLCFRYTKTSPNILKNITFQIEMGQCIAIVGKSGSGKSTLLKVIGGLYNLSSGRILVNGNEHEMMNKKNLVKQIGIVPQDAYLFNKTIYDNLVADNEDITEEQIENILRAMRIYDEIMQMPMGLNTVISEMGTNLSGGQRQRLIIARELLKKPSLLLLDEATSALDYINEKNILEYISNLKITCLMVTHRISSVQNTDHILFMKDGKIIERGSHRELMEMRGHYYDMYQNDN